jgi:orotidine-5'-phosphate decarboxylase
MDQLLIALDVDSAARAMALTDQLKDVAGGFKIGSRLFTAEGPTIVRRLAERGVKVFLDLKFHDIPSTVAGAVRAAADLGVWMLTVHAVGGINMLQAAKEATGGNAEPRIIGVTVLTSFNETELSHLGITRGITAQVEALAELAKDSGIDGVVASPLEISSIRARCGKEFTVITPGIRNYSDNQTLDDQHRTQSAGEAIRAGANYLVVGRPIIAAVDPKAAAIEIARQIEQI